MKTKFKTKELTSMGMFVALISICAWILIPLPMVSFTMQTFAVYLCLLMLGGKMSTFVVVAYLMLGAIGLPIFSGMKGGLGILFGTTGGYLFGFIANTLFYWGITKFLGDKTINKFIGLIGGTILCYIFGTIWFIYVYNGKNADVIGLSTALTWCVTPFVIPDLAKIFFANMIYNRIGVINRGFEIDSQKN